MGILNRLERGEAHPISTLGTAPSYDVSKNISMQRSYAKAPWCAWNIGRVQLAATIIVCTCADLMVTKFMWWDINLLYSAPIAFIAFIMYATLMYSHMNPGRVMCVYVIVHWISFVVNSEVYMLFWWRWNGIMQIVAQLWIMIFFPLMPFFCMTITLFIYGCVCTWLSYTHYGSRLILYNHVHINLRLLTKPWSQTTDTIEFRQHIQRYVPTTALHELIREYMEPPPVLDLYKHSYGIWLPYEVWLDASQAASFYYTSQRFLSRLIFGRSIHLPWRLGASAPILRIPIVHPSMSCRYHGKDTYAWNEYMLFDVSLPRRVDASSVNNETRQAIENLELLNRLHTNWYATNGTSKFVWPMFQFNNSLTGQIVPSVVSVKNARDCFTVAITNRAAKMDPTSVRPWYPDRFDTKKRCINVGSDETQMSRLHKWIDSTVAVDPLDPAIVLWIHVRLGVAPWRPGANDTPSNFDLVLDLVHVEDRYDTNNEIIM